jgi:hypothetical protein
LYHSSFYASHAFGLGLSPTNQTTQYDGLVTSQAAIDSDLCAFAQATQDARGEHDHEGEGDSKDKHRSSHACCHHQAALSRRLAVGDAAVGACGGGHGAARVQEARPFVPEFKIKNEDPTKFFFSNVPLAQKFGQKSIMSI